MKHDLKSPTRLAWRPKEVAETLGLSLAFIRKEIRLKNLKITKFGRAVLVLDEDLRKYINKKSGNTN
jgi:excisionase family DNA binding protein